MCISSRCFFPPQRLDATKPRSQEETVKDPDMSNGSNRKKKDKNKDKDKDSIEEFATVTTNENKDDPPEPEEEDEDDEASQKSTTSKGSDRLSLNGRKNERRPDAKRTSNASTSKPETTPGRKSSIRKSSLDSKASAGSRRRSVSIASDTSILASVNKNGAKKNANSDTKGNDDSKATSPFEDSSLENKDNLRRKSSVDSKGRRVSFQEEVKVRVFDANEGKQSSTTDKPQQLVIDNIDSLIEEVTEKIGKKPKDAPVPSLEELCNTLAFADDIIGEEKEKRRATTSRARSPIQWPVDPATFEREFDEMDQFMRRTYPKYYYFLRSQIVTAHPSQDSVDYMKQELEFKEAIVSCAQHSEEYLRDLEKTMSYYDKMSNSSQRE